MPSSIRPAFGLGRCLGRCRSSPARVRDAVDSWLEGWGLNYRQRLLVFHFVGQLKEQVWAVLPISLLLIFVIGAFFQQQTKSPGQQAYGLVSAMLGLLLFMEGLRVCVMPLAEMVGGRLPLKCPLPVVLLVAGCLGVLVTYAEPAISSLSPLAKMVDKRRAPYLYYALNDKRELLVLSIGLGVGAAAVVGTLRFLRGWSLKPIVYVSLVPTVALACYMQWGNPDLAPLLGLAWDCGAVTTGPVTVPILLALGIGIVRAKRQKEQMEHAAADPTAKEPTGPKLEGFGVVTLASIFPVLAVEMMAIMLSVTTSKEHIILNAKDATSQAAVDKSPLHEVVYAIRAIMPLITALLLIVIFLIREPLPPLTVYTVPPGVTGPDAEDSVEASDTEESQCGRGGNMDGKDATLPSPFRKARRTAAAAAGMEFTPDKNGSPSCSLTPAVTAKYDNLPGPTHHRESSGSAVGGSSPSPPRNVLSTPTKAVSIFIVADGAAAEGAASAGASPSSPPELPTPVTMHSTQAGKQGGIGGGCGVPSATPRAHSHGGDRDAYGVDVEAAKAKAVSEGEAAAGVEPWHVRYGGLICGIVMSQVGMILFNIGLTYGFTALGDQAGTLLPAAYLQLEEEPKSPYYSYAGGIVLVLAVAFALGFMATRAEPVLRVLGRTVERLSGGTFTSSMLIYTVSFGVGTGMAVGSTKILFGVPLMYLVLATYTVAVAFTLFSEESITNIAWDSAGVTTGPVTVPFVLSLGIGFSKATQATEGFGILAAASAVPVISVLLTSLLEKPAKVLLGKLPFLPCSCTGPTSRSPQPKASPRRKGTRRPLGTVASGETPARRLGTKRSGLSGACSSAASASQATELYALGSTPEGQRALSICGDGGDSGNGGDV
ncbi:hypothetical protein Agub_g11195 [Astrephomene gubernaculifera]|uniref:DUF1538 domain-containing protein n=1 Tax=Astrephomene gubernaculifera TaxID=47775 RepID=A0AAD3HQ99_9CHLO|nr:hypothetical protein Agub_g11195 [Astrephomene gubernaculifera]